MKINEDFLPLVISSTEPVGNDRKKIWFRKGKNLCDGINQHYFLTTAANICGTSTGDTGLAIPVKKGTYTISTKTAQSRYRVAFVNSFPTGDSVTAYRGVNKDGTNESITIENSNNYKYLIVNATDLSSILVEQGSKATSYEAYIEPQIFVKNSNGVYEEFLKESEELDYTDLISQKDYEKGLNSLTYQEGFRPLYISSIGSATDFLINGKTISLSQVRIMGFSFASDSGLVLVQIGILTYCSNPNYTGKVVCRWKHGGFGDYPDWHTLN